MSILTVLNRRVLAFKIFEIKDVAIVAKNICTFFLNHQSANFKGTE